VKCIPFISLSYTFNYTVDVHSYCVCVVLAVRTSGNWMSSCRFYLHHNFDVILTYKYDYISHFNKQPKFSVTSVSEQLHDQTYFVLNCCYKKCTKIVLANLNM